MKQLISGILFIALFGVSSCQAQSSSTKATTTAQKSSDTLIYKVRETKSEHPALIILMHGYGSNEDDLLSLASYFPENYIIVSLQAPVDLGQSRYQWFSIMQQNNITAAQQSKEVNRSEKLLYTTIQSLQQKYKIAANRTFVGGFSQGGIMSYQLGLNHPDLINGIFVLSGRMLPYVKESKEKAVAAPLNIFIAHGEQDNVIAYKEATAAHDWLKARKYKVDFKTYTSLSHSINGEEIQDVLQFISEKLAP